MLLAEKRMKDGHTTIPSQRKTLTINEIRIRPILGEFAPATKVVLK